MPVTEAQFVEWVQGSGGLIMVSSVWLQEVCLSVCLSGSVSSLSVVPSVF